MWCSRTGADDTSGALAGTSVRIIFRPSVNDQDKKPFYRPNRSPSLLIRVWIVVCRCERIVEYVDRSLKLYAVNPKVRSVFLLIPLPNQLLGLDPDDVV
jgi:hypothetical protein